MLAYITKKGNYVNRVLVLYCQRASQSDDRQRVGDFTFQTIANTTTGSICTVYFTKKKNTLKSNNSFASKFSNDMDNYLNAFLFIV